MTRFLFLFFLFFCFSGYSYSRKHVDSLIVETKEWYRNSGKNDIDAVDLGFKLIRESEKINYERGIFIGYYFISQILTMSGECQKSIDYIEKASTYESVLEQYPIEKFHLKILLVDNYDILGLQDLLVKTYQEAESIIMNIKDKREKAVGLFYLYSYAANTGYNKDSVLYYLKKTQETVNLPYYNYNYGEEVSARHVLQDKAFACIGFGDYYYSIGNIDSSKYYLEEAMRYLTSIKEDGCNTYVYGYVYDCLGDVSFSYGDYSNALVNYKIATEVYKKLKMWQYLEQTYSKLGKVYTAIGDTENYLQYTKLSASVKDTLEDFKKSGLNKVVVKLIENNEKVLISFRKKHRYVLMFILSVIVLTALAVLKWYMRHHAQQVALLSEREQLLKENALKLDEKSNETELLQQELSVSAAELIKKEQEALLLQNKVNESFVDLIEMAKNNHQNFYTRYKEVYPDLHQRLLEICPDLRVSELTLCAYIYLDFTTKEISEYTFKSIRTIQTRKFNLRKKLGIPSQMDFHVWLKSLYTPL